MLQAYMESGAYLGVSESTKKSYSHLLKRLSEVNIIPEIENYMQLPVAVARSRSHADFWVAHILSLEISNGERNRTIVMLKIVYSTLGLGNLVAPIKMFSYTKGEVHPINKSLIEKVKATSGLEKAYVVLLRFSFYTGMRPSEIRDLKWENISQRMITVIGSKGREKGKPSRMVAISDDIRDCLNYYRATSKGVHVACGVRGNPLNKDVVCREMAVIRKAVGFEGVLYDARRGIATELDRAGVSVRSIGDFLGHKNVATTYVYINKTMEEKALSINY